MTEVQALALREGDRVMTRIGGAYVAARVLGWRVTGWLALRREGRTQSGEHYPEIVRTPFQILPAWTPDPGTANVYADWLEEQGEARAAALLRAAFPVSEGLPE